jgi:protease YdgD
MVAEWATWITSRYSGFGAEGRLRKRRSSFLPSEMPQVRHWNATRPTNGKIRRRPLHVRYGSEQNAVLTAADCIFNRRTNRFLLPSSLHVLLGYERGKYAVHALVGSYTIGPGYDPASELATASSDWALLQLLEPLPDNIRPLKFVDRLPSPGSQLMLASYALSRLHIMTADMNCQLVGQVRGSALFEHTCRVTQGSSGAPLVMMKDGSAVIMGLQIAVGRRNGADIMLAVAAPSIMDNLLHRIREVSGRSPLLALRNGVVCGEGTLG